MADQVEKLKRQVVAVQKLNTGDWARDKIEAAFGVPDDIAKLHEQRMQLWKAMKSPRFGLAYKQFLKDWYDRINLELKLRGEI